MIDSSLKRHQIIEQALRRFVEEGADLEPQKRYLWQEARAALREEAEPYECICNQCGLRHGIKHAPGDF
jgi:hypothetical protein